MNGRGQARAHRGRLLLLLPSRACVRCPPPEGRLESRPSSGRSGAASDQDQNDEQMTSSVLCPSS
jgi:hypothetical protein